VNEVVFSSASQEWETPAALFAALDAEFGFDLDAAATDENAKCPRYFTKATDALRQRWEGVVFLNPPYGHQVGRWVRKAHEEAQRGATVVALIPSRTCTAWWHDYVMRADEIRLIRGRLYFGNASVNAPFPSAIVVFREGRYVPRFASMDRIIDPSTVRDHRVGGARGHDPAQPRQVALILGGAA
jgi:phage N-6-adenine-methyltransferase